MLPRDVSADGWRIDRLLDITMWFIVVIGAVALVLLIYSLVVHGRSGRKAMTWRGTSRKAALLPLGIAFVIFAVVDGNLFVTSTVDLHETFANVAAAQAEPDAVRIEVNAHQWAWDARYAGPDGLFATDDDVVTLGDLRAPVGRAVVVQLASVDVIHAFYLPNFRIKQDVIPGRLETVWFRPTEAGTFEMACAQHCGVNHYKMRGTLTIMEPAAFDRWVADMSADSLRIAAEDRRAEEEEPSRRPQPDEWPAWPVDQPGRNWGWAWRPAR